MTMAAAFLVMPSMTADASTRYTIQVGSDVDRASSTALHACKNLSEHLYHSRVPLHTLRAFNSVKSHDNLVLDLGCGTGRSTLEIARALPLHNVLGIDRSATRLATQHSHTQFPPNARFLRADIPAFWRLAFENSWAPAYQFVLYPNPYPKQSQIKVRERAAFALLVFVLGESA